LDILGHFGKRFTPDAVTALPVRLVLREEYGTTREGVFLEDPSPLVEVALQDVVIEEVDVFADVKRSVISWATEGNVVSLSSALQKPIEVVVRTTGGKDTVRRAEHCLHLLSLSIKVSPTSLDDADRVDPQVLLVEVASRRHGVSKRGWKTRNSDSLLVLLQVIEIREEVRRVSPRM
jgi:hypothetical protein